MRKKTRKTVLDKVIPYQSFTGGAFSLRSGRGQVVPRASGKAVSTWPLATAVDAGPMEIQLWEGGALRCAEVARQRASHDTMCE